MSKEKKARDKIKFKKVVVLAISSEQMNAVVVVVGSFSS